MLNPLSLITFKKSRPLPSRLKKKTGASNPPPLPRQFLLLTPPVRGSNGGGGVNGAPEGDQTESEGDLRDEVARSGREGGGEGGTATRVSF